MATFKKDWKAGDRPVSADANRWETNTNRLHLQIGSVLGQ